jgi:hypothetical protein
MAYDLLGKNFVPPDVHGKVTGKAKYAEDFCCCPRCRTRASATSTQALRSRCPASTAS